MSSDTTHEVVEAILDIYREQGTSRYDEQVSQNAHALQTGALAIEADAPMSTIAAAFLHDVGHLLLKERGERLKELTEDRQHENVATAFLSQWFGDDVCEPIRMHVAAKRYLCAVEPQYFDGLSQGSVRSLRVQGGPMTADEIDAFQSESYFATAVDIRRWDDLAKVVGAPTPSVDDFGRVLRDVLSAS